MKIKMSQPKVYSNLVKKLINAGMTKKRAGEIAFHLCEIEHSSYDFQERLNDLIKSKNKKNVRGILEDIWSEFGLHISPNHINPLVDLIDEYLFGKVKKK